MKLLLLIPLATALFAGGYDNVYDDEHGKPHYGDHGDYGGHAAPEPATWGLMAAGLGAMVLMGRKVRK